MEPVDIEMYETLRDSLSERVAKNFVRLFDTKFEQAFHNKKDVLATKHDLALLQSDITELRLSTKQDTADLRVEIARTESRIIKWMFIFWIGQIATVIAIMK